jgi:aspartate kinase
MESRVKSVIVQKYGGTSVESASNIKGIARKVALERAGGQDLVIVVSAMGDTTDELMKLADHITTRHHKRDLDMLLSTGEQVTVALLCMALREEGVAATGLTGWQAGISTTTNHGGASILSIAPERIQGELKMGNVVVVAGFQGITGDGDISTLGRGGSDTTAAALATKLGAERCEIYTDVEGVYTSDPRYIKNAVRISSLTYEEMLTMARRGAGVLHPKAIEHAMPHNVPLVVRSSTSRVGGTWIHGSPGKGVSHPVCGVVFHKGRFCYTLSLIQNRMEIKRLISSRLTLWGMEYDTLIEEGGDTLAFLVAEDDLERADSIFDRAGAIVRRDRKATVTVVAKDKKTCPVIRDKVRQILQENGIAFHTIENCTNHVTTVVEESHAIDLASLLHSAFGLDEVQAFEAAGIY